AIAARRVKFEPAASVHGIAVLCGVAVAICALRAR
ncbi:hypothetical protein A2U01_0112340, partial [Trifolium medium]|nr:hypothetical protein [Trifolium medium]